MTSPLNSLVVSGIPTTTSYATALSFGYAQMFTDGASYSVSMSALRQSTTQQNTLFNPGVTSRLSIGFNQPLLAGFGIQAQRASESWWRGTTWVPPRKSSACR